MLRNFLYKMGCFSFFSILIFQSLSQLKAQNPPPPFNLKSFPYADIHVHSAFKPFNSRHTGDYNLWDKIDHDCEGVMSSFFINQSKDVPKSSQANFEGLIRGNVRLAYLSLTPLEKQAIDVNLINTKKKGIGTLACISGIMLDRIVAKDESMDYYPDLVENILYVERMADIPHYIDGEPYQYEIIKTAPQLAAVIQNPKKLAVILNIEGGHALGHSLEPNDISSTIAYENYLLSNIDRLKGIKSLTDASIKKLEYPIVSMNINHFFWNGLAGHARTFSSAQNMVFGQNKGMDTGMTPLGEKAIKRLLDKNNGRRILIDIKHMSIAARQWYYGYLEEMMEKGDTIAIVSSHSSMAGMSWNHPDFLKKDNNNKLKNAYLYNWTISLTDEDILMAHRTKGLIGLMLDKNKIVGDLSKKIYDDIVPGSLARRKTAAKIIWMNFFAAIKTINHKDAWNILCFGSDFDGMIIPFESYPRSNEFPDMVADMYDFLKNPSDIFNFMTKEEVQRLMFDLTPEEIIEKIMFKNAYEFTLRHLPQE